MLNLCTVRIFRRLRLQLERFFKMKHEKSVIKIIRDKKSNTSDHIAMITGRRYVPKPVYYRNTETEEDYFAISGALSWPTYDRPGFAVIVAALKDDPKPNLSCDSGDRRR